MSDGAIFYTMGLDTRNFAGGMEKAIRQSRNMDATMGRIPRSAGRAGSSMNTAAGSARGLGGGLAFALTKVGPLVAGLGGLAAAAAGIKKAFNLAADFESTQVAFKTLIGDAEQTKQTLDGIKELGASTPFEFPELANAGRKLIAFGEGADTVVDALRRIGDVSAGIQAPVGEIAEIYGKARVQGTLYAEDMNQLMGRGIPIMDEIGKIIGKSASEVKKLASEGKITFPLLDQAFRNMTAEGGKFHGMMAAQSKTTNGLLSTLKDNVNDIFRALGQPLNDAIRPMLTEAVGLASRVGTGVVAAVNIAKAAVSQGKLGEMISLGLKIGLKEGVNHGVGAFIFMGKALLRSIEFSLRQAWSFMTGGFNEAFGNIFAGLGKAFYGLGKIILAELGDPFLEVAAMFQAGLSLAIDKMMQGLLKIPGMKKLLGFDEWKETSFADYLSEYKKDMNVGALRADGKKLIAEGMSQAGKGVTQAVDLTTEHFLAAMSGHSYKKSDIFDTSGDKSKLAEITKNLAPEEYKKFMDALHGTTAENTKAQGEASEKAKGLANALNGAGAAAKKNGQAKPGAAPGAGGDAPDGRKRIKLYNAEESAIRRYNRLSDTDKKKAGGTFKGFLDKNNTDALGLKAKYGDAGYQRFLARMGGITGKAAQAVAKGVGKGGADEKKATHLATEKTLARVAESLENLATA